ncbi:GNAT family N-acetyltransferase [Lactiplantibacillus daowaiensis]|uniref:GNAT family N-acetyltransferase n=1 Tax=Lactiplantibacillus daowaiensis TaxID=2559918 RepID=A0ABW1S1J9_9LACO|nr:GNAT family N-acetyltransferase [Lactiplantibacillus daowaiensis]
MTKFEKYHPILTPHYTFDWLTKSRVKDVWLLQQQANPAETMLMTADMINQTMRDIFHDQKLVWGITDRQTDQFIGSASLTALTTATPRLTVHLITAQATTAALTEIYTRLTAFATNELGVATLTVPLTPTDQLSTPILTKLGYQPDATQPLNVTLN